MNNGGSNVGLRTSSLAWRWILLALATLWGVGVACFIFGYHINEPNGVLTVTTGGRTFAGNPPALTLYERDGAIWVTALILIGLVVASGLADLVFRMDRCMTGPGVLAIVAGALLVLYSLFGLIYGLLGIGTIGILVILVGLPMKPEIGVGPVHGTPRVPI